MIPAGQGMAAMYDAIQAGTVPGITNIEDLFSDDIHLNDIGRYFIACIHFVTIHQVSPVGLTHQLKNRWGGEFDAPSASLALKFQEIAWETVSNYPRNCFTSEPPVDVLLDDAGIEVRSNPTSDIFEIQGTLENYTIEIIDNDGNATQPPLPTDDRIEINLQALPPGLYIIKIQNENNNLIHVELILKQS